MSKYKRRRLIFLLLALPLILLILRQLSRSFAVNYSTFYPKKIEYLNKIDTDAYMIFNEVVYTATNQGIVDYEVTEGTKVARDHKIASLSLTSDNQKLKEELLRVQSTIEYKNQDRSQNSSYEINEQDINLISSIQKSTNSPSMKDRLDAIEALELNTRKNIDISEISELINRSNQELEDRKEELSREISISNIVYKAEQSGVVSYKVDGLENKFSSENFDELNLDFLEANNKDMDYTINNNVRRGDPIFKIIDNFQYYMAVAIKDKELIESFEEGENLEIIIDDILSINGRIYKINEEEEGAIVIIYCTEKLMELGYDRHHKVSLIKDRIDTYMIESDSIVEVEGQTGVYVKGLNGLVKFVPVEIFLQQDQSTLVLIGDESASIELSNGAKARTITIYDELISDPVNVREGQVI